MNKSLGMRISMHLPDLIICPERGSRLVDSYKHIRPSSKFDEKSNYKNFYDRLTGELQYLFKVGPGASIKSA
jgi:hypothetical protein